MPVTSNRLVGEVSVPRKKAPRNWSCSSSSSSEEKYDCGDEED
ncbi:MAG: hypothetical protein JWR62_2165 [Modestobacter sp.]|jgi:hypothetical protein|nr:hypothetical protein [Modestobacter sp.]HEV7870854.1 hypothetical protein [Modestobacter sp.]